MVRQHHCCTKLGKRHAFYYIQTCCFCRPISKIYSMPCHLHSVAKRDNHSTDKNANVDMVTNATNGFEIHVFVAAVEKHYRSTMA